MRPHRERTFPYRRLLPYATETDDEALQHLKHIMKNLYIALQGRDLDGVFGTSCGQMFIHWTRELASWLRLKFEMPIEVRKDLTQLYFDMCLRATESHSIERFSNILGQLWSDQTLRNYVGDLQLDWPRLFGALKKLLFLNVKTSCYEGSMSRTLTSFTKLCYNVPVMSTEDDIDAVWSDLLPLVSGPTTYISNNLLSLITLVAAQIPVQSAEKCHEILPTLIHLWTYCPKSILNDLQFIDIVNVMAQVTMQAPQVEIGPYGFLDEQQLSFVFNAIVRMLEPPLSGNKDENALTLKLSSAQRSSPSAELIIYSLSGNNEPKALDMLERLLKGLEPFCHPSNQERYTEHIFSLVADLTDLFTYRWNEERSGESRIPQERHLTHAIRDRFVSALLRIIPYGIYSKSRSTTSLALTPLLRLTFLAPDMVIPQFLREIYPSLQNQFTPHRTLSCLSALSALAPIMASIPKYAMHLTALLELVMPSIDANDPTKTIGALRFVQIAAYCVPFVNLSEDQQALAMEQVSYIVNGLLEQTDFEYPDYTSEDAAAIVASSSYAFDNIVTTFFDQILLLAENMPDQSNEIQNSPESSLVHCMPYVVSSVLNSIDKDMLQRVTVRILEFITENVLHNSTDIVAHICGRLVGADPETIFPVIFPILDRNIRYEVVENKAGTSRNLIHRDRALIWYLSILNMSLASANKAILKFKQEITDLTFFLRDNTRGQSVYHTTNTIHHTIMSLISTYCDDSHTVAEGAKINVERWGEKVDLETLQLHWHVPTREEIEFAVELYEKHILLSLSNIDVASQSDEKEGSLKRSDVISNNLTFIGTATSSVALLIDQNHDSNDNDISDEPPSVYPSDDEESGSLEASEMDFENVPAPEFESRVDDEIEYDLDIPSMRKYRTYATNSPLPDSSDPLYKKVHELRHLVGERLHSLHIYLSENHDHDISAFKELLFAIKVWFADVGYERGAKYDHHQRTIYNYESRPFSIQGFRKGLLPRPVMARRAMLYHLQRLVHNVGARSITPLDRLLLFDLVNSAFSIYPDIRRHTQSSLYSTIKVLVQSRTIVYPKILNEVNSAIDNMEFKRAESGLKFLNYRSMSSVVKRGFKHLNLFVRVVFRAVSVDNPQLNQVAGALFQHVVGDIRLPIHLGPNYPHIQEHGQQILDQSDVAKVKVLQNLSTRRRALAERECKAVLEYITSNSFGSYWRVQAMSSAIFSNLLQSPQLLSDSASLTSVIDGTVSSISSIKRICQEALVMSMHKMCHRGSTNYNFALYCVDSDETKLEDKVILDPEEEGFTSRFFKDLNNHENPPWYNDCGLINPLHIYFAQYSTPGWLLWPKQVLMQSVDSSLKLSLLPEEQTQLHEFGKSVTREWLAAYLKRNAIEPKPEDNHFQIINGMTLKYLFLLSDHGFLKLPFDDVVATVEEQLPNFDDPHWQRTFAEVAFGLITGTPSLGKENRERAEDLAFIIFEKAWNGAISHETLGFWRSFTRWSFHTVDHRRAWKIVDMVRNLRVSENSGLKDALRLSIRSELFTIHSWRYRDVDDTVDNLITNLSHQSEGVRDEIALQLSTIIQTRYYEGNQNLHELLKLKPCVDHGDVTLIKRVLSHVKDSSADDYNKSAKTLCSLLENLLSTPLSTKSMECILLEALPIMVSLSNSRDDTELTASVTRVFSKLSTAAYPEKTHDTALVLVKKYLEKSAWHQKLRILLYLQGLYVHNGFQFDDRQRELVLDCILIGLEDKQVEVRDLSAAVLTIYINFASETAQIDLITNLKKTFSSRLRKLGNARSKADYNLRHAAVLGLGALVAAFPYNSPPPEWVPSVLCSLAGSIDGGVVGKSVKRTLGDFKRLRQDTWTIDQQIFSQDELDSLEGVLFKNYFV